MSLGISPAVIGNLIDYKIGLKFATAGSLLSAALILASRRDVERNKCPALDPIRMASDLVATSASVEKRLAGLDAERSNRSPRGALDRIGDAIATSHANAHQLVKLESRSKIFVVAGELNFLNGRGAWRTH